MGGIYDYLLQPLPKGEVTTIDPNGSLVPIKVNF